MSAGLARRLGPAALVFYGIGDILGAGIYALVGKVAAEAGTMAWASFLVSAALAAVTGLAYAELCARVPRSAGSAAFAAEAFAHPLVPYTVGLFVLMSGITSTATVSLAVHGYLKAFLDVPQLAGALLLIALMGLVAFWGIRESVGANNLFTLVELSGLLLVVSLGLAYALRRPAAELLAAVAPSAGPLAVLSGATLAFYAFIGFEDLANLAEEAVDPVRDIPRAILVSVAVSTALYLVVVLVVLWSMTPEQAAATPRPLLEVLKIAGWPLPDWCFSGVALFAVANTGLANFIMASRLLYGMGDSGLAPRALARVHATRRTPWVAVLAAAGLTALLVLTAGEKGVALMAKTTALLLMLAFIASHLSLIRLRRRPAGPGVFRAPAWTPYAGIAVAALMLTQAPREAWLRALGVLACGLVLYAATRRKSRGAGETRRRRLLAAAVAGLLIAFFWTLLLSPFYVAAFRTGLPGMRGGPQDAFRHTLASAFAARYVSPGFVDWVTAATELGDSAHARMDRHNNRIGRDIGAAGGSPRELHRRVLERVAAGREDSGDPGVTTWLPERRWSTGL